MKVLQVNSIYPIKSTGRIAKGIADVQRENGIEPYIACGEAHTSGDNIFVIGSRLYNKLSILMTRLFGKHGFYNYFATKKLFKWVDGVKPDIIHLHNIHGHYINIKLLFEYIKKHRIPVVWTLHDCWSFTGHCAHFDYVGCDRWKTGCGSCPMQKSYPVSWLFDRSQESYRDKKALFTNVSKMHIATPSNWLNALCKQSYLGEYPVTIVPNGLDTDVFKPTVSDIRKELSIEDKFVILGVINKFSGYKGGEYFLELSKKLSDDEVIVLLSLEEKAEDVPENIIPLPKTSDDKRLAEIYSMADVFVNPTLQDIFSMVNLEALSCGTPVVTFKTGGAAEMLYGNCGYSVPRGDLNGLYEKIQCVKQGNVDIGTCRESALHFKTKDCFEQYLKLYKSVLEK